MGEDSLTSAQMLDFVRAAVGGNGATLQTLVGDMSTRRYHRVTTGTDPDSVIVMELPVAPPPTGNPPGPSFVNVQQYLEKGGLPVPRVYRADLAARMIVLEDLGDLTFESAVAAATNSQAKTTLYMKAAGLIVALQRLGREHADPACMALRRRFDGQLLRWELEHFREWFLLVERQATLTAAENDILSSAFEWITSTLLRAPQALCHRDFQSRNILIDRTGALRIIDFQDALMGSQAYDLVALLRDSYAELDHSELDDIIGYFVEKSDCDRTLFLDLFQVQTLQRKLKDAGRFVFADRRRGNPSFLRYLPTTLRYIRNALSSVPALHEARVVLQRHVPELR